MYTSFKRKRKNCHSVHRPFVSLHRDRIALEVLRSLLIPEIEERVKKMYRGVDKGNVDRMCKTEGFENVKSYYAYDFDKKLVSESVEVFLK